MLHNTSIDDLLILGFFSVIPVHHFKDLKYNLVW